MWDGDPPDASCIVDVRQSALDERRQPSSRRSSPFRGSGGVWPEIW
jgi:hypothetical protein